MMLSFLATQGFAIMYYGGAGWQFGKRKVSGMSNEEVNAMSPNQFLMKLHGETRTMVPTMAQGMKDMTPLISTTIQEFGAYIREAVKAIPAAVGEIFKPQDTSFSPLTQVAGSTVTPVRGYYPDRTIGTERQAELDAQIKALIDKYYKPIPHYVSPKVAIDQAKADALRMREIQEARARNAKAEALIAYKKRQPILPQLSITEQQRQVKRKAGRSQILERTRLIRAIASQARLAKNTDTRAQDYSSRWATLRSTQQLLVNLLARYRFV